MNCFGNFIFFGFRDRKSSVRMQMQRRLDIERVFEYRRPTEKAHAF